MNYIDTEMFNKRFTVTDMGNITFTLVALHVY